MLRCKIGDLESTIMMFFKANLTPIIWGDSAIGKTDIIEKCVIPALARDTGDDVILHKWPGAGMDERDSYGVPIVDVANCRTKWSRPAILPEEDGNRHVLFIDDFGHMSKPAQQPLYSLIHGGHIGGYELPAKSHIILASNQKKDGGGDNAMLRPLAKRVAHVLAVLDNKAFLDWATLNGFDPPLLAFLTLQQEWIYKDDPENPASTSPRKLEMANRILKQNPLKTAEKGLIALCGEGFARACAQFYTDCGANLPKLADIRNNPTGTKVPTETHHQYVIARAISEHIDESSAANWAKYLKRLSPDLASMAAKEAMTREESLKDNAVLKGLRLG